VDNDISAFSKGVFRCCRQLVIVYMFIAQYLSVKSAVLMHLSFTCITRMIDFAVVCLSTCFQHEMLWVTGHIRWVMGHISDGSVGHGSIPMTHCLLCSKCLQAAVSKYPVIRYAAINSLTTQ